MRISDWSSDVCSSDLLEGVKVGDPSDPEVYMGPLISEAQREKVHGMVERAVAAGATLVMGGHPIEGPGYFYAPTLLTNVDPDSEVAQDELRSEEHTSELQSLMRISYAAFCLKKKQ